MEDTKELRFLVLAGLGVMGYLVWRSRSPATVPPTTLPSAAPSLDLPASVTPDYNGTYQWEPPQSPSLSTFQNLPVSLAPASVASQSNPGASLPTCGCSGGSTASSGAFTSGPDALVNGLVTTGADWTSRYLANIEQYINATSN